MYGAKAADDVGEAGSRVGDLLRVCEVGLLHHVLDGLRAEGREDLVKVVEHLHLRDHDLALIECVDDAGEQLICGIEQLGEAGGERVVAVARQPAVVAQIVVDALARGGDGIVQLA